MVKILRLSRMAKLLRAIPELSIVPRATDFFFLGSANFLGKPKIGEDGDGQCVRIFVGFLPWLPWVVCTSLLLQGLNSWIFGSTP